MPEYKKTGWMSADGFYQGSVAGYVGGKWSWDMVEVHDYGDVPVCDASGYDSEEAAFNGMCKTMADIMDGEPLVPMTIGSFGSATVGRFRCT